MTFIDQFNEAFYNCLSFLKYMFPFVFCISIPIAIIDTIIHYDK